ncbi:KTSC domain-containing protein [Mesorhizobium sp. M0644]
MASGKRYEFEGVPPETFAAFKAAFANGRYFNEHIRNHFRYRLVDRRPPEQHQQTISFGRDAAHSSWPSASPLRGKVGHRNERRIREFYCYIIGIVAHEARDPPP